MRAKMGPRSIMEWIEMVLSIRGVRKLSRNAASGFKKFGFSQSLSY